MCFKLNSWVLKVLKGNNNCHGVHLFLLIYSVCSCQRGCSCIEIHSLEYCIKSHENKYAIWGKNHKMSLINVFHSYIFYHRWLMNAPAWDRGTTEPEYPPFQLYWFLPICHCLHLCLVYVSLLKPRLQITITSWNLASLRLNVYTEHMFHRSRWGRNGLVLICNLI